jgi:DNA-binding winged helix-turn-helix (wHTH) protein
MLRRMPVPSHTFAWIAAAVVAATAIGATWGILSYRSVLDEAFADRSLAYVQAFAASTTPWLSPPNPEMLEAASRFMLVGSALYVQIVLNGEAAVEERTTPFLNAELPVLPTPESAIIERRRSRGTPVHLDVIVPLPSLPEGPAYVRIGIDEATARARKRSATLAGAGIGLSVDLVLLGLLWWLLPKEQSEPTTPGTTKERTMPRVVGDLAIDPLKRRVTLAGTPVKLTPKQFALLEFLASEPDRVYSDREIVAAVWADSPYADSKDVKQYVYLLRRRLAEVDDGGARLIVTVPGFGYKLISASIDEALTDG